MKRLLLFAVLVAACVGLLAAPAFAYYQPAQPENAYVLPFGFVGDDGILYTYWTDLDPISGEEVWHDSTEAIPKEATVWLAMTLVSPIRGTVRNFPQTDLYALSLSGPEGYAWSISGAASRAVWSPIYLYGVMPAFNKAEATYWARDWWQKLGVLSSGVYTGTTTERVTRLITDSSFMGDEWAKHAQQRPYKLPPGTYQYDFSFTVAEDAKAGLDGRTPRDHHVSSRDGRAMPLAQQEARHP